jgi:hypothetical protein
VNVTGWSGSALALTFQRPTHRKSPHVGNLHYRHLRGYRLGVKTAGSAISADAELRSSALVVREFSFLGWNGQGNWQLEVQRIPRGIQTGSGGPAQLAGPFCIAGGGSAIPMSGVFENRGGRRRPSLARQSSESSKSPEGQQPSDHAGKRRRDISASQTCALQRDDCVIVGSTAGG